MKKIKKHIKKSLIDFYYQHDTPYSLWCMRKLKKKNNNSLWGKTFHKTHWKFFFSILDVLQSPTYIATVTKFSCRHGSKKNNLSLSYRFHRLMVWRYCKVYFWADYIQLILSFLFFILTHRALYFGVPCVCYTFFWFFVNMLATSKI